MVQTTTIRVVAAVARRGDRYLVCQRPGNKRHGGLWEFPGGKLEPGESAEAAVRRELMEELGVVVRFCGPQLFVIRDPGSEFAIEFHPVEFDGEPECLEHDAVQWADLPALGALDLAPSDQHFVAFLQGAP